MTSKGYARFETVAKASQFLNTHITCFTAAFFISCLVKSSASRVASCEYFSRADLEYSDALDMAGIRSGVHDIC